MTSSASGGTPVALMGHAHSCPEHGSGTIVSGSSTCVIHGRGAARIGDKISCGATIVSGSETVKIDDGRPVARKGDTTDHGGVITEGDETWTVE